MVPVLTYEQIENARYNWYKWMGITNGSGFWMHLRDEYGVVVPHLVTREVSDELYDYIMALNSPHFMTLMKARQCRKSQAMSA